jgi:hypothetical protein
MHMQMQLRDLLESGVSLEMAYTQKKAERVITGLEKPINDHLLKLWTNPDSIECEIWIGNLINWIDEIGEIVFRPSNARPSHTFYYKLLFFEPFGGGAGIPNVLRRLRRLHRDGFPVQMNIVPDALLTRLQAFHRDLSGLYACKVTGDNQIRAFLEDH